MPKTINVFIQARMSSARYPGKVLAPLGGIPLIKNLIDRVRKLLSIKSIVVLTSCLESDDPLFVYLESIDCLVFRGDLDNVFMRFQDALKLHSADYCMRLCADSPYVDLNLMQFMIDNALSGSHDLVSNVFSRKFPKGQSIEIIRSQVLLDIDSTQLSKFEQEHVMPYFYKNLDHERCLFFELHKDLGRYSQCVDTIEDLKSINPFYTFNFDEVRITQ